MKNSINNCNKKTIGIVFDDIKNIQNTSHAKLPHDAYAEWESQETIDIICETWKKIGLNIVLFPIDDHFMNKWTQHASKCHVIHSLVEGFGSLAREGWIPSLCELNKIPYIGSNPFVHSICMNKHQVKLICNFLNIPTAESYLISDAEDIKNIPECFLNNTHFIKPNGEGSGMGIDKTHSISSNSKNTIKTVKKLLQLYQGGVLLEKYLPGTEYTTGIIGTKKQFLPVAQIEVPDGVYGYANKSKDYLSEKITFPKIPDDIYKILQFGSEKLFSYLQMEDMVRFDWKCDENEKPYFLEANTLPGLSKIYSTLPLMAKEAGIEYEELFQLLFESALNT